MQGDVKKLTIKAKSALSLFFKNFIPSQNPLLSDNLWSSLRSPFSLRHFSVLRAAFIRRATRMLCFSNWSSNSCTLLLRAVCCVAMSSRCCCMKIPQIAACFRVFVPSSGRTSGPCVETSCASEAKRLKVLASASWPSVSSSAIPLSVESNGSVPGWPPRERQD